MVEGVVLSALSALLALGVSGYLTYRVLSFPTGTPRMREISEAIREGAYAFMKVQYGFVALFTGVLAAIFLAVGFYTRDRFWFLTALGFVLGAFSSALAGLLGMTVSVKSNVRVAEAARTRGLKDALALAFRAGAVNGFAVVGLGILGISVLYILYKRFFFSTNVSDLPLSLVGFAFGASLVSLFARIAGGIYTKAADVGADLVGKVEAGIPEDDPRNPAVIADNVGDNVGDCAGMGADLFETYVVTLIASMALAGSTFVFQGSGGFGGYGEKGILFPLLLGAVSIVASVVGLLFVRLPRDGKIMKALYGGTIATVLVSGVGFWGVRHFLFPEIHPYILYASYLGLLLTLALVFVTDYYTSQGFRPVRAIVDASTTGPATTIIQGLAVGLESVLLPILLVVAALIGSYTLGERASAGLGLYGIAVAASGMLSVAGFVVALDTYGPITDNAGGIVEMSGLPKGVRTITDALDAVGNTTKATTKGYAIGSAALATLVLFSDFVEHTHVSAGKSVSFEASNPYVLAGLLLGSAVVFLFGSRAMSAVGRAAHSVVHEVRRQFADGEVMAGKRKPDYASCVRIVTRSALREMAVPGALAVGAPLLVGFALGPQGLGGLLIGVIVVGFATALLMANAGAAWDNGKKSFESGIHGGKGSEAHKASVVGDTVGDPFKDTAGPAINPLIKAINTLAVIFAGVVVAYSWVKI